jgi:iron(III) transport system ATP-binding protein
VTALSVRGVTKAFGPVQVLRGVDLEVPAQSLTAVLGPSGCGKTTLLRLIAGFDGPDAGSIAFGQEVVASSGRGVPAQRRRVGYVPQEGALFPHLDVAANITFGLPRSARRAGARVDELLELVGLDGGVRGRQPHQLSGGQQQRVALARALAPGPSVVLLDEPFASLDAGLREETGRAVARALQAAGATAVLVTHDQGEALSLADQVAVMRAGRLVQVGAPEALYGAPVDPAVAEFVGAAVVLAGVVQDGAAACALGRLVAPAGSAQGPVRVLVRPEQIELHPPGAEGAAAQVLDVSYFGHDATVRLRLPEGEQVVARVSGPGLPETGAQVRLVVRGPVRVYPTG